MPLRRLLVLAIATAAVVAACTSGSDTSSVSGSASPSAPRGIEKLDHLIFIVQENRSFDQYFGTYPGADGIPTNPDGSFSVCAPDKFQGGLRPAVRDQLRQPVTGTRTHHPASVRDINGGKMDGFIDPCRRGRPSAGATRRAPNAACSSDPRDNPT